MHIFNSHLSQITFNPYNGHIHLIWFSNVGFRFNPFKYEICKQENTIKKILLIKLNIKVVTSLPDDFIKNYEQFCSRNSFVWNFCTRN